MNEGVRSNIQNSTGNRMKGNIPERGRKASEIKGSEEYLRYLEAMNRNSTNRIKAFEEEKSQMIKNAINEYRLRMYDNRK